MTISRSSSPSPFNLQFAQVYAKRTDSVLFYQHEQALNEVISGYGLYHRTEAALFVWGDEVDTDPIHEAADLIGQMRANAGDDLDAQYGLCLHLSLNFAPLLGLSPSRQHQFQDILNRPVHYSEMQVEVIAFLRWSEPQAVAAQPLPRFDDFQMLELMEEEEDELVSLSPREPEHPVSTPVVAAAVPANHAPETTDPAAAQKAAAPAPAPKAAKPAAGAIPAEDATPTAGAKPVKDPKPAFTMPSIELPKLPKLKLPELKFPELKLPEWKLPHFHRPEFALPHFHLPKFKLPDIHLPKPSFGKHESATTVNEEVTEIREYQPSLWDKFKAAFEKDDDKAGEPLEPLTVEVVEESSGGDGKTRLSRLADWFKARFERNKAEVIITVPEEQV